MFFAIQISFFNNHLYYLNNDYINYFDSAVEINSLNGGIFKYSK